MRLVLEGIFVSPVHLVTMIGLVEHVALQRAIALRTGDAWVLLVFVNASRGGVGPTAHWKSHFRVLQTVIAEGVLVGSATMDHACALQDLGETNASHAHRVTTAGCVLCFALERGIALLMVGAWAIMAYVSVLMGGLEKTAPSFRQKHVPMMMIVEAQSGGTA